MTNQEPSAPFLRQSEVLAWLGIGERTLLKWAAHNKRLRTAPLYPGGKTYYRKSEIMKLLDRKEA